MDSTLSPESHPKSLVALPGDVTLQYLAEGAANIIYRFTLPPPSPPASSNLADIKQGSESQTPPPTETPALHYDPIFEGRLLRLRKALPSSSSNMQTFAILHKALFPLFPLESLLAHDLVSLPTNLLNDANKALQALERTGGRPSKRHGLYLMEYEPYGVLVTDMTPDTTKGEVLLEFKPKWLVQSHSAPKGWKRCRTCALRLQRNTTRRTKGQQEEVGFCPLDLASEDRARVERAVSFIVTVEHAEGWRDLQRLRERLIAFLLESTMIPKLKALQGELDMEGALAADVASWEYLMATTIRDCSIFIKIPCKESGPVEARIGDLDVKSPDGGKADYWRELERSLIDEGWYTGTEIDPQPDQIWCTQS